jgi:ElaB/YqjD/DUF883 family membrane-anchored ribosome-binding protein
VENRVTAPAEGKTPEQIQAEMAQTRESLTEKVSALETQVVGTVQTAADTLTGTVESVKSFITTAPGAVTDTVKQAADVVSEKMKEVFDISGHVRAHPWTAVGVSTGLGFLTGLLIFRDRHPPLGYSDDVAPPAYLGAPTPTTVSPPAAPPAPSRPGMFDEFLSMLGRKFREVAENVINTAGEAVNRNVSAGVPKLVDRATEMAADRLAPDAADDARTGGRRGYSV